MLRIIKLAFQANAIFCFGLRADFLLFYLLTCCCRCCWNPNSMWASCSHVRECSSTYSEGKFGEVGFSENETKTRENINKLPKENRHENKKTMTNNKVVFLFHCPLFAHLFSNVTNAQYVCSMIWLTIILIFRRIICWSYLQ